jgi:D-glycero-D-manno-heptose 1,7-bisphosphate phosphatase
MSRAAFLDRDGVINRKPPEGDYVTRWEEFQFLPGVVEAIVLLNRADFRVIVVTNQRSVAKGLMTAGDLDSIHQRMCDTLAMNGATIDSVYYCPHELQPPCNCRKPQPGMLLSAAAAHGIDLTTSWMIGDSEVDVEAGRNAGCKTALLSSNGEASGSNADVIAPSLVNAVRIILQRDKSHSDSVPRAPEHRDV